MLIQRRNINKYHSGDRWANACCSHPRHGEKTEDAVSRRLREELGISCGTEKLFGFVYFSKYADDLFEYEYDHVFLGEYYGGFDSDPDEIEELRWIGFCELEELMLREPQSFSSWFMIETPRVLSYLAEKQYQRFIFIDRTSTLIQI